MNGTDHLLHLTAKKPNGRSEEQFAAEMAAAILAATFAFQASGGTLTLIPVVDLTTGKQIGEAKQCQAHVPEPQISDGYASISLRLKGVSAAHRALEATRLAVRCSEAIKRGEYPAVLRDSSTREVLARFEIRVEDLS